MNMMSLDEVMRAFDYVLSPCSKGLSSAMSMAFYVEVNCGKRLIEVNSQHRIVNVMVVPGEIEFNGQKGLIHIVLWNDSDFSQSYTDILDWEVIHDRKIYWEGSLSKRMSVLVSEMSRAYNTVVPDVPVVKKINFFINGFPKIVTHKGVVMYDDRKICRVAF